MLKIVYPTVNNPARENYCSRPRPVHQARRKNGNDVFMYVPCGRCAWCDRERIAENALRIVSAAEIWRECWYARIKLAGLSGNQREAKLAEVNALVRESPTSLGNGDNTTYPKSAPCRGASATDAQAYEQYSFLLSRDLRLDHLLERHEAAKLFLANGDVIVLCSFRPIGSREIRWRRMPASPSWTIKLALEWSMQLRHGERGKHSTRKYTDNWSRDLPKNPKRFVRFGELRRAGISEIRDAVRHEPRISIVADGEGYLEFSRPEDLRDPATDNRLQIEGHFRDHVCEDDRSDGHRDRDSLGAQLDRTRREAVSVLNYGLKRMDERGSLRKAALAVAAYLNEYRNAEAGIVRSLVDERLADEISEQDAVEWGDEEPGTGGLLQTLPPSQVMGYP